MITVRLWNECVPGGGYSNVEELNSDRGFAGALLAMAVTPSGADELFTPYQPVQLPNTGTLAAFDISFVNPELRTLAVAASRVVDTI
jgi:hypothetical protein